MRFWFHRVCNTLRGCVRCPRLRLRRFLFFLSLMCLLVVATPYVRDAYYARSGHQVTPASQSTFSLDLALPTVDDVRAKFKALASSFMSPAANPPVQESMPVCRIDATDLVGSRLPSRLPADPDKLVALFPYLNPGGRYSPRDCMPRENTAIIIPFRNRHAHLYVLLRTLIPILTAQKLRFSIYVIEQNEPSPFNKGTLYNAGVLEALSREPDLDCFIFHDADMLPHNDHNIYQCDPTVPLHLVAGVDKWKYGLLYETLTGGVLAFTKDQFQKVNGFSNLYFGWANEDDDMSLRIQTKFGGFHRKSLDIGKYDMLRHSNDFQKTRTRFGMSDMSVNRIDEDGLNNVAYHVTQAVQSQLYTWIKMDISMREVIQNSPKRMKPFLMNAVNEYRKTFGLRVNLEGLK